MKKALIHNSKICQVQDTIFPVSDELSWVDCPDDCTTGWSYIDGDFVPQEVVVIDAVADAKVRLKMLFLSKMEKPTVDTGLGFSVDGGRDNLQDFQGGLALGVLKVRSTDNEMHTVTAEEMASIIKAIQGNGMLLYQHKWELEALIDIDPETDISEGWPE